MRTRNTHGMAPARSTPIIITCVLLSFLAAAFIAATPAAAAAAAASDETTCVPSLQRLLSCLDFIEHRSDEIPTPCCIEVRRTVAEQPCCLMHVVRGNAARLIGPEYDNTRAVVNVTAKCLGDASVLMSITRNCSGSISNIHNSIDREIVIQLAYNSNGLLLSYICMIWACQNCDRVLVSSFSQASRSRR